MEFIPQIKVVELIIFNIYYHYLSSSIDNHETIPKRISIVRNIAQCEVIRKASNEQSYREKEPKKDFHWKIYDFQSWKVATSKISIAKSFSC